MLIGDSVEFELQHIEISLACSHHGNQSLPKIHEGPFVLKIASQACEIMSSIIDKK